MTLFLLSLAACKYTIPNLPPAKGDSQEESDPPDSDSPPESTATDSGTAPARCDLVETEPNNTITEMETLPTELWACGEFLTFADTDIFGFSTLDAGWMELQVAAADRGSAADVQVNLYDDQSSAFMSDGYLTSDPNITFPVNAGDEFGIILAEHTLLSGESYFWFARASQIKAPVEWTRDEVEDNSSIENAETVAQGDVVFGTIGEAGDFDWFYWEPPEGVTGVTYQIKSGSYGAPTNLTLLRYDETGDLIGTTYSGTSAYDPDPIYNERFTEADPAAPRFLQIEDYAGVGSRFAWYVLEITPSFE